MFGLISNPHGFSTVINQLPTEMDVPDVLDWCAGFIIKIYFTDETGEKNNNTILYLIYCF
jgi:hypothetical protein